MIMSAPWLIIFTFTPKRPLLDKDLDDLSNVFDELEWTVGMDPFGSLSVTAFIEDGSWTEHITTVMAVVLAHLAEANVPAELVKVEAVSETQWRQEAVQPNIRDLVAAKDVAEMLGVTRQRIHQLQERDDFPEPLVTTGGGSLWARQDIEAFNAGWDRRPGRRSTLTTSTTAASSAAQRAAGPSEAEGSSEQQEWRIKGLTFAALHPLDEIAEIDAHVPRDAIEATELVFHHGWKKFQQKASGGLVSTATLFSAALAAVSVPERKRIAESSRKFHECAERHDMAVFHGSGLVMLVQVKHPAAGSATIPFVVPDESVDQIKA